MAETTLDSLHIASFQQRVFSLISAPVIRVRLQTCFAIAGLKSQGTYYIYPDNEAWAKPSPVVPKLEQASASPESLLKHTLLGPGPRVSDSGSLGWGRDWEFAFLTSSQVGLILLVQGTTTLRTYCPLIRLLLAVMPCCPSSEPLHQITTLSEFF